MLRQRNLGAVNDVNNPHRRRGRVVWLRRSVSNLVRSTCVGSNPVVGTTNHKPTANSAAHPSEVGK